MLLPYRYIGLARAFDSSCLQNLGMAMIVSDEFSLYDENILEHADRRTESFNTSVIYRIICQ